MLEIKTPTTFMDCQTVEELVGEIHQQFHVSFQLEAVIIRVTCMP